MIKELGHFSEVFFIERYEYYNVKFSPYREVFSVGGVHYQRSHCINDLTEVNKG